MSNTRAVKAVEAPSESDEFDLDAAIDEADNKPFKFTFAKRKWTLPHMGDLDTWVMVSVAESGGDLAAAMLALEAAFGDQWEDFHALHIPQHAMNILFARYAKHSGMNMGELLASVGS